MNEDVIPHIRHHYHTPLAMSVMCQPRPFRWSAQR